jgi:hypothetical protein
MVAHLVARDARERAGDEGVAVGLRLWARVDRALLGGDRGVAVDRDVHIRRPRVSGVRADGTGRVEIRDRLVDLDGQLRIETRPLAERSSSPRYRSRVSVACSPRA